MFSSHRFPSRETGEANVPALCWASAVRLGGKLCAGQLTHSVSLVAGNQAPHTPSRKVLYTGIFWRGGGGGWGSHLSTATAMDGEAQPSVGENMNPSQSLQRFPMQKGKDNVVVIESTNGDVWGKKGLNRIFKKWINLKKKNWVWWKPLSKS